MKIIILAFFGLMLGVSYGQASSSCGGSYLACFLKINPTGVAEFCNTAKDAIKCAITTGATCGHGFQDTLKAFEVLINDSCDPASTFAFDIRRISVCMTKNIASFKDCTVSGEPNNIGELCDSIGKILDCFSQKASNVCSPSDALDELLDPFTIMTETCSTQTSVVFYACEKGLIQCGLQMLSDDFKCTDLQKVGTCMINTAKSSCASSPNNKELMTAMVQLERYLKQIPDYCNKDSTFRKNFDKSYLCIFPKLADAAPCYSEFKAEVVKLQTSGITDVNELTMKVVRLQLQMHDCFVRKIATPCGKEAESAIRFLLLPAEELLDETCLAITKKRCNGANGLISGAWLLILSSVFLLTRYFV